MTEIAVEANEVPAQLPKVRVAGRPIHSAFCAEWVGDHRSQPSAFGAGGLVLASETWDCMSRVAARRRLSSRLNRIDLQLRFIDASDERALHIFLNEAFVSLTNRAIHDAN